MVKRRRALIGCAALVATVLATPAAAQSTTEDGIRAVLRGDYQAAARILRPLADDPAGPNPVAQFFLAVLYDTGHGVPRDEGRACGLFVRAAAGAHPFSEQSAAVATIMRAQLGGAASLMCVAEENWGGGPPQSFLLGPNHRVVFAETSIRVTYGDREERTLLAPLGAALLPIRHTQLVVTRPIAARRDMFQWFFWKPNTAAHPSSWALSWVLSEVVGERWIALASEQGLVVVNDSTVPESYDVGSVVRLRVNATGEAEFTIVGGTSPRTEVIPSHGSR